MSQVIQDAIDKTREVEGMINGFFDTINEVLSWIPDLLSDLRDAILRGVNSLKSKVDGFWEKVNEFRDQTGSPDKVAELAQQWSDVVALPIGDLASSVKIEKLKTHVEWEGRAAEAYQSSVSGQSDSLTAMKNLGIQIRDSLNSLERAISNFWLAITGILVGLLAAAGAAIVTGVTGVGLPAAIGIVIGALSAATAAIIGTISMAESTLDTVSDQQTAISDKLSELGNQWPKTNLSAMSHKDDWEIE